jgi:C_GCAxxG_C_C family probable redox protein
MLLAVGEHVLGQVDGQCACMATGFAGGVGNTEQEMCGALSGGVMVISGLLGRRSPAQSDEPAFDLTAQYRQRFLEAFGYTQCERLRDEVVYAPGGPESCAALVERTATILLTLLDEMK